MSQQKNKTIRVFDEDHFDFLAPPPKKLIGPSGEIWVTEFDESSAFNFREAMISKSKESPAPIIIYIDSYGGQVDALAKMIETMDEIDNIKITVCMGKAMSAGAILLSHGDVRYCGQHSRIMIHESLGSVGGRMSDINANTEEMNRINNYFIGMLANNCGIRGGSNALKTMIKERGNSDWYMDAHQALEFKIIDFVGIPVLRQNFESGLVPIVKKNTIRKKIFHEVPPSDFLQEVLPKKPKKPKSKNKK